MKEIAKETAEKIQEAALGCLESGLSVLPAIRAQKRPACGNWKTWSERLPTRIEVEAWFANRRDGICIVAGAVSGNLECLDFDNKGELYEAWKAKIDPMLMALLTVERSPSGGYHVLYRCKEPVDGNMKLARGIRDGKLTTLIETRGEGGLFLCCPTEGYVLLQGDFAHMKTIEPDERKALLEAARSLDEEVRDEMPATPTRSNVGQPGGFVTSPWVDFCERGDIHPCLEEAGWQHVDDQQDGNELWRRPGKTSGGHSATFNGKVFYNFSSNAKPFEVNKGYNKFQVYALLQHRGDFIRAAAALFEKGYGKREDPTLGVDFSAFNEKLALLDAPSSDAPDAVVPESAQQGRSASGTDSAVICRTLAELFRTYPKLREPIVCGLLRKGETMNLIAPPKTGKSWLVGSLAMAVARGEDWIGFHCVKSRVLIIDNELHGETITDRFRTLCGARSLSPEQFQDNLVVESQRGKLRDVNRIMELCESYSAFRPSLVIIDAFYRALPKDVEENNNGAITQVYNQIDAIANKLGCAIVLVHHTSKGNQAFKSTTDSGAGAGAISRAADTHVVLRRHKEKNCAVFDAVVRSWPGFDRFGIRFGYPLWTRDDAIDVEDIEGVQVKKDPPAEVEDDELVRALVGQVDPENPLSKTNFINQAVRKIRLGPEQSKVQKKFVCIALETAINAGYLVCDRVEHPKRGQQASKFVMLGEKRLPEKATDDSFGEENESDDED